jgi:asparagine synthase (glutamine-hydrolysing)
VFLPEDVAMLTRSTNGAVRRAFDPGRDLYNAVAISDLRHYTRNILLRDTDAMSMANSLEVRVPLLDDRLVDWTLGLPGSVKGGRPKELLKAIASRYVPREIVERPKQGFVLPLADWMRGDLRIELNDTLLRLPDELEAVLDPLAVARIWRSYVADGARWVRPWSLFALAKWCASVRPRSAVGA